MSTYSLSDRQPMGPGAVPDTTGIRGGVQGGVNPGLAVPFTPTPVDAGQSTLTSISRFAQARLAPLVQREREARFLKGASRVAQGEAAADIEAQRPAWAVAFGDDDEVLGAMAYQGKADAARAELALRDTMEQDAELDPDTYAATLQERMRSLETGDADRDTAWKTQVLGSLPMLMKEHAKAHKAWSQKRALVARDDAIGAHMAAFEVAAKQAGAEWSVADRQVYFGKLLSDIAPVMPGENPEVRDQQLTRQLESQVAAGRFAAVELFRNTPELWQSLSTQSQDRLEQLTRTRASQEIAKAIGDHPDLWAKVDDLGANTPDTSDELLKQADGINDELRIRTGIPADFITQNDLFRLWGQKRARDRQDERAAAAEVRRALGARLGRGRTAERVLRQQQALQAFSYRGGPARVKATSSVTQEDLQTAGDQLFGQRLAALGQAKSPEERDKAWASLTQLVDYADDVKIPALAQQALAIGAATQYSAEFQTHVDMVQRLGIERAGKLGYWSEPGVLRQMEQYQQLMQLSDPQGKPLYTPQTAFAEARARVLAEPIRAAGTRARKEADQKLIDKTVEAWADPWLARDRATPQSVNLLKSLLAAEVDRHPVGMSNEAAVATAWGRVQQTAKSFGPVFYLDKSGSNTDPWRMLNKNDKGEVLGFTDPSVMVAPFEAALSKKLGRESKLQEADFLFRIPAPDGDFAFLTTAVVDGITRPVVVTKADIEREMRAPKAQPPARTRPGVQPAWKLPQYQ